MPTMAPPNPNTQTGPNPNNTADPNQQPDPNQEKLDDIRIVLTSLDSNVDSFAREAAHNKLAADREKGSLWKRMTRGVWNTMMREHVVVKATHEARDEILESGNLRYHKGIDENDKKWREDTVRRYSSEYAEHLIHDEAGETFHKFDKNEAEAAENVHVKQMRDEALELVRQFARGDITSKDDLEAMQDRMFEEWREKGVGQEYIDKGQFLAHNITEMAEQVKAAIAARQGLSDIDRDRLLDEAIENAEFVTGEAKVGSRVEIEATRSERLAKKLQKVEWLHASEGNLSRIGAVLSNEMVVASMLSVAFAAAQKGASVTTAFVPGLAAGIIAGIRERRAMRDERALMGRRLDNGEQANTRIKDQAELDATLYESRPAGELLDEISAFYDKNGDLIMTKPKDLKAAIKTVAEIRARIQISDRDGARLINFADISANEMEGRRFDLDLAMAKFETDVWKVFDPRNQALRNTLEIDQWDNYKDWIGPELDDMVGFLKGEMKAQDRLFNKLVLKRVFKRRIITVLSGGAVGFAASHVYEAVSSLVSEFFGIDAGIDMVFTGNETDTVGGVAPEVSDTIGGAPGDSTDIGSEGTTVGGKAPEVSDTIGIPPDSTVGGKAPQVSDTIGGGYSGSSVGGEAPDVPDTIGAKAPEVPTTIGSEVFKGGDTVVIGDKTKLVLPEGYRAEVHGNGLKLTMPNGTTIDAVINKNGQLDQNSLNLLKDNRLNVIHHPEPVQGEPKVTHEKVGASRFVENHRQDMVKITHEKWFTQNTSKYDLNELGLNNNQLDNGNIRISIQGMTAEGTFNGESGMNWHEAAKQGQLKLYLSASPGTQTHAFEIPIDPDGTIDIDKDSPAGALFNKEGKFIGGYQEVAVKGDTTQGGATKIATLATVVGTKHPEINDVIVTPTITTAHTYAIVPPAETASSMATFTQGEDIFIPTVPVYARRNLGEAEPASPPAPDTNTGGNETPDPNNQNATNENQTNANTTGNAQGGATSPNGGSDQNTAQGEKANGAGSSAPGAATPNGGPTNPNASQENNAGGSGSNFNASGNGTSANFGSNPNNTAGNASPNAAGGGNPNEQKQQGDQKNGGAQTSNNGRSNGDEWKKNANQSTRSKSARQNGNPNYTYANRYTAAEQRLLGELTEDPRGMPDTFASLPWNPNMTPIARKIMAVVLHELINASNRQPGETEGAWRIRVITAGRIYAERGLRSLGRVSPGVRPFTQEAFDGFLAATEPAFA